MAAEDFQRLLPHLKRETLEIRKPLQRPGEPIRYVFFLEPCVASVVATTPSGEKIEVGLFGPEGMSGLPIIQGADRSPFEVFIQVAGNGISLPADELRKALDASATLRRQLLSYAHAYSIQVGYTALANGRFGLDERLARWLLMCHDRVDGDVVALTHDFLALMLGVRRAGVTTAMHILESAKIIRASRGRIEILDREQLREAAGDSYGVPEEEYERLMG